MSTDIFFEQSLTSFQTQDTKNTPLKNYQLISVIGKGAFATVLLVKSKINQTYYAMKIMKKKKILQTGFTTNILTQKTILSNLDHPFIVKLRQSFQDSQKLYLVMDYCPGGQLLGLLSTTDKLTEQQSKFYAAQVLLVLQKLHQKNIIYRDLKPQNILLDSKGYLKITDFGLSKCLYEDQQKTLSICGTPEYFTPEMIKRKGHNKSVDWWCFGCLIYQMVVGFPPFMHKNRSNLFDKILYEQVSLPPHLSPQLRNLLSCLLKKDPNQRLGSNGTQQVKYHKWFKNVNYSHLITRSIKPPYTPTIKYEQDVSNFSKQFTNIPYKSIKQNYEMIDEQQNDTEDHHFLGFDYGGHSKEDLQ